MKLLENVVCPISNIKIDSHVSRLTVFLNAVFIALYLWTGSLDFMILVAVDYAIRAAWSPKFSPLRGVAWGIARGLRLREKLVDQAPKLFASRVGCLFAAASVVLAPFSGLASLIVGGVLGVFALMDSVCNFCVGCLMYHYIVFPFYQHRRNLNLS